MGRLLFELLDNPVDVLRFVSGDVTGGKFTVGSESVAITAGKIVDDELGNDGFATGLGVGGSEVACDFVNGGHAVKPDVGGVVGDFGGFRFEGSVAGGSDGVLDFMVVASVDVTGHASVGVASNGAAASGRVGNDT